MKKVYKNDSNILGMFVVTVIVIPLLLLLLGKNETASAGIIASIFILIPFFYLMLLPGCWDAHLYPDKLIFRNELNVFWSNEWEFALKDVVRLEVRSMAKSGPCIYVFTRDSKERFYTLGYQRTQEFTQDLRRQGIKVESELE